ncbi:MAG: hypothetical protein FWD78_07445 [Treponema sp.]|nr:hypothetical protein [Treponema sp.]
MLINGFENPPVQNRPRPFWFFNGDMDRDEIRHQITEMKDKGLGGFFLCARQGLRIPYLSKEWFDLCKYCADVAKENGLEVWLYDEYPYPSGMAGGEVTIQHPQARQKILDIKTTDLKMGEKLNLSLGEGILVSAIAYPADDGKVLWEKPLDISEYCGILQNQEIYQQSGRGPSYQHNYKRYFTYGPSKELRWNAGSENNWKVITAFAKEIDDFKYYGTYMDPANEEAVKCFIGTTYEPYKKLFKDDLGKTVKGMFADETGFLGRWPWSPALPEYFRNKYNYSLVKNLGAFTDKNYPDAKRIRYNYFQCVHELLRDHYHKPISQWCEKNNINYVTEIHSIRMSNQMYSQVPGGDPCHDKLGFPFNSVIDRDFHFLRQNPKAISAMARQFNRRDSVVEAFHSMGWTATLQDMKWQIDRLTVCGISLHNFHAYYYTVNGITKHDAPPSQFLQNPYWEYYKTFADYCARSSRFITETDASISVAILHPAIMWCTELRQPFHRWAYVGNDKTEEQQGQQLINDYKYICKTMFKYHIEYEDLDPEVMAGGRIESGTIFTGKAKYTTLVVPPITCIEKYCFDLIVKFIKSGGKVLFTGLTPFEMIDSGFDPAQAFESAGFGNLPGDNYFCKKGKAAIIKADNAVLLSAPGGLETSDAGEILANLIKEFVPDQIEVLEEQAPENQSPESAIVNTSGPDKTSVITSRRQKDGNRFILLASPDGKNADVRVLFKNCPAGTSFYELDLENGSVHPAEALNQKNGYLIDAALSPWSARIFAMAGPGEGTSSIPGTVNIFTRPAANTLRLKLDLDKKLPVAISGGNVYRLEEMEVKLMDREYFLTIPNTFIEHFKESGFFNEDTVKFSDSFGIPQNISVNYPIDIKYHFKFNIDSELFPSGVQPKIKLLRDRMGIMGKFKMFLNNKQINQNAWKPYRLYDQNNIAADIANYLKPGVNNLCIKLTASQDWHGVSDPMYLIGNFGVLKRKDGFVIAAVPVKTKVSAKAADGFSFYSGKFFFETRINAVNPGNYESFTIELPQKYQIYECVQIAVNGRDLGVRAFSPYVWQGQASLLKNGPNAVKLTIANTLGNMFEASYFDYEKQETVII